MTEPSSGPYVRPDVRAFLDFLNAQEGPKMHQLDPGSARAMMTAMRVVADAEPTPLALVKDLTCPGPRGAIKLRLYDARESRDPGPVLVFYHGGGWVIGDIDTHEPFCTEAARLLDIPVISVDYRMAPEDPWPASPDDCEAAARWVAGNPAELGRAVTALTLGGDSAGGNLTIVTAMRLRETPAAVPVIAQLPIYPATDMTTEYPSYIEFAEGHLLTRDSMEWFNTHYAADISHADSSPALFDQRGMPPAVVVTASLDPIRDQGRVYAKALADAGIDHEFIEFQGTIHGFICLRKGVPSANADVERLLLAFRRLLDRVTAAAA